MSSEHNETHNTIGSVPGTGNAFGSGARITNNVSSAPDAGLVEFARAVADRLPELGLTPETEHAVRVLSGEILETAAEEGADGASESRGLRALGLSLRAILEGTAAGALSATLLNIWP